jgi:hypothetical protein
MSNNNQKSWREQIEEAYVLMCKFCHRKVMDPDKNNNQQIFTKAKCPHCSMSKDEGKKSTAERRKLRVAC